MVVCAQRLAAQRLGHDRLVVTILTGNLELHSSVLSLSLGQVSCSGVLGRVSLLVDKSLTTKIQTINDEIEIKTIL